MFKSLPKKKAQYTVCYFQRSRLSVYIPVLKEVATLDFPPTILADVTVVDQEQFRKAITKLLAQYKVDPGPVLVVLAADVCFVQEVAPEDTKDKKPDEEILTELRSSMPFSNVFARIIRMGKRQLAVALNREFYEPLLAIFREEGFEVTTLIPESILDQPVATTGLTPELAVQLALTVDKLEAYDLLEAHAKPQLISTGVQTPAEKKRTVVLVGVFMFLMLVLVGVWWWVHKSTVPVQPIVPPIPDATQLPILIVVPTPLTTDSTESASGVETPAISESVAATAAGQATDSGLLRNTSVTPSSEL